MKIKTILILIASVTMLLIISEIANYLTKPDSQGSTLLNTYFIKKSISEAAAQKFDNSIYYLSIASRVNIYGEYDNYRKLLPKDYLDQIEFPEDMKFKDALTDYLANLIVPNIANSEDQGLGIIYYNLAQISYDFGKNDQYEFFLRQAMYNNPEFASFHAELINYYFTLGKVDEMNKEMDYCLKFKSAKTLCGEYKDDSLRLNIAKPIGYMSPEVERHYLGR